MKCVVFFSGGIMSWAAAKRAVARFGVENTTLLFTDTLIEDADLYRFLDEAAANVGAPLVKIAYGLTPWEIFNREKLIGNTRADPCSKILKREIGLKWLKKNCDADTVLVFGIHWEEQERLEALVRDPKTGEMRRRGVRPRYEALGFPNVIAPMCDKPWVTQAAIMSWVKAEGIALPRLYDLGFAHNNCGGFCVKAGEGHFAHLLTALPQVYDEHERQEDAFNAARPGRRRQTVLAPEVLQPDGSRKRVPLSMREFRERAERDDLGQFNLFNIGGCGCFLDEAA